jgi:ABC-2 type transport system ATP-binding protein
MNESIISVVGLTKDFRRLRAVDDLTFEVARGRVTGFLGPNGDSRLSAPHLG